jgi:two-component system, sensor histidine kinase
VTTLDLHMNSTEMLQSQIRQLGIVNKSLIENIESLKSIGDFFADHSLTSDVTQVFKEVRLRLRNFIPFHTIGFMLVQDPDSDFVIVDCEPSSDINALQNEIDAHINTGTFAWALQQSKATVALTMKTDETIIFHPLIWDSRTVGMLVGIIGSPEIKILDASLNFLSVICTLIAAIVRWVNVLKESSCKNIFTDTKKGTQ